MYRRPRLIQMSELVVSARTGTSWNVWGSVHVLFFNRDGNVKRNARIESGRGGFNGVPHGFGLSVAAISDLDGDGVPELDVGATSRLMVTKRLCQLELGITL